MTSTNSTNSTDSTNSTKWCDRMGHRSRGAWLLLVKNDEVQPFLGKNIPGVAVVRGSDYRRDGRWSCTTYRLVLAPGVRAIAGHNGWETGRFAEGLQKALGKGEPLDTWVDLSTALGVSVPAAKKFLCRWRPKAAEAFDKVDQALEELDRAAADEALDGDNQTVVVSFGAPTRRQRAEGFWEAPKSIPDTGGELRLVDEEKGWRLGNIKVHGAVGTVLNVSTATGYGGGYVSVTVAIVVQRCG